MRAVDFLCTDKYRQLFIHLPCGLVLCYKVKNSIQAVEQLKDFVQSKTGMPKVMTKFLFSKQN